MSEKIGLEWNECVLAESRRAAASYAALKDFPVEAIEQGVVKELVEALKESFDQIIYLREHLSSKWARFTEPTTSACLDKARAALAKAGVK